MANYYAHNLSADRLHLCYKISPRRIKQYLNAEIETIVNRIKEDDFVLELGCGYGRVLKILAKKTKNILGIDISFRSLKYACDNYLDSPDKNLAQMNAAHLGLASQKFDLVFCIQNGLSAFKESPEEIINEAIRVTRPGGMVVFSSYSGKIWSSRLEWFKIQSAYGLIGEIDFSMTGNGVITCKDGFKATTFCETDFRQLTANLHKQVHIHEVDKSSIFCEIFV